MTAGQEEFRPLRGQYHHRNTDCFILVSSLENIKTVEECGSFLNSIGSNYQSINDIPIIFVLNKVDLLQDYKERMRKIEEFRKVIESLIEAYHLLNTKIIVTSAKTGECVNLLFEESERMVRFSNENDLKLLHQVVDLDSKSTKALIKKQRKKKWW